MSWPINGKLVTRTIKATHIKYIMTMVETVRKTIYKKYNQIALLGATFIMFDIIDVCVRFTFRFHEPETYYIYTVIIIPNRCVTDSFWTINDIWPLVLVVVQWFHEANDFSKMPVGIALKPIRCSSWTWFINIVHKQIDVIILNFRSIRLFHFSPPPRTIVSNTTAFVCNN